MIFPSRSYLFLCSKLFTLKRFYFVQNTSMCSSEIRRRAGEKTLCIEVEVNRAAPRYPARCCWDVRDCMGISPRVTSTACSVCSYLCEELAKVFGPGRGRLGTSVSHHEGGGSGVILRSSQRHLSYFQAVNFSHRKGHMFLWTG